MSSWLASPYRAAGIYIGGSMRACGDGNLSSAWVTQVRSMGWGLLPIYVGAQAPCVNQGGLSTFSSSQAAALGASDAVDAVSQASRFGLTSGTPIYYDMESYNSSVSGCSKTVMSFISAWTAKLHSLGYKSGVYGNSSSLMVDMSQSVGSSGFVSPDNVWFASWNQLQTTSDSTNYPPFTDANWIHHRVHQYSGGASESWGGATVNIDANWVDASVAGTAGPVAYGTNVVGPGGSGFVFTGSMSYWRPGAPAGLKNLEYWTYSNGSTEGNGATWAPQLSPGRYDVEAYIPSTSTTANAPYTVRDALGTTKKVVNQLTTKGYTSLGTYTARAGSSISVHVGDNDPSSTSKQIGVDAMAFRLISTPTSAQTAVVKALYADLLLRPVDAGGLASWSAFLAGGGSQQALVAALTSSSEYVQLRIRQAYQKVLGRAADAGGFAGWTQQILAGRVAVDDVQRTFYASQEFVDRSGGTDAGYVAMMYQSVLGRTASSGEVASWVAKVHQYGRGWIVNQIWFSGEAASARVDGYYLLFLKRPADPAGRASWAIVLLAHGEGAVRTGIAGSAEYGVLALKRYP
jgi:hypothetical protein